MAKKRIGKISTGGYILIAIGIYAAWSLASAALAAKVLHDNPDLLSNPGASSLDTFNNLTSGYAT